MKPSCMQAKWARQTSSVCRWLQSLFKPHTSGIQSSKVVCPRHAAAGAAAVAAASIVMLASTESRPHKTGTELLGHSRLHRWEGSRASQTPWLAATGLLGSDDTVCRGPGPQTCQKTCCAAAAVGPVVQWFDTSQQNGPNTYTAENVGRVPGWSGFGVPGWSGRMQDLNQMCSTAIL